jgi:phage portal protein BeeE
MLGLARAERARRTLERAAVQRREQLTLEQLLAESSPPTYSGVPVTTDTAARHSAVWACWRLLGDTISTLPVDVYRRGTRGAIDPPAWLERPQADADLVDWLYMLVVSLCARGNAYGLVVDRSGATMLPSQIEILHPDRVNVTAPKGQILYRVAGEEIPAATSGTCAPIASRARSRGCRPSPTPGRRLGWAWPRRSSARSGSVTGRCPPACCTPTPT